MNISKRLRLNTWFSLGAVIFILFSIIWTLWESNRTSRNGLLVNEIERAAFERSMLRDDWLLNREDRARDQWYAKSETTRRLLESASQRLTSKEAKDLLEDARGDFEATFSLFSIVIEKHKREERVAKKKFVFTEVESRQISQVFLRAYSLIDNISRLREHYQKEATEARNRGIILIVVFIIGGIMVIVLNSIAINKIVTKRVAMINKGLAVIGGGNLEYQIDMTGDDELADLARASNDMAAKLKQSYTSMENLQREISERKKAEENIKMLSAHQQALITAIPDIIMEVDTNKVYTWVNDPGINFFGEDVIGKPADLYFVRVQNTYDTVRPIFNGSEEVIYVESWQRRKDGQERLLAWWCRVLKDAQGNVTGALSSARDVTERKQAERSLLESEERFRSLFENSLMGISAATPDGHLIHVNPAYALMYGYDSPTQMMAEMTDIGQQLYASPEKRKEVLQILTEKGIMEPKETEVIKRDGTRFFVLVSAKEIRDDEGRLLYYQTAHLDITERKKAESQREAALEEIYKLNAELDLRVAERTAELSAKTAELERINKVFTDRELRMRELKARIAELERQLDGSSGVN